MKAIELYLGLDVHKDSTTIAIAIAEPGPKGEIRLFGTVSSDIDWLEQGLSVTMISRLALAGKTMRTEIWISPIMAQYPNSDTLPPNIVQEVVRKTLKTATPKSCPVEMEALGIFGDSVKADLKLREEILSQLNRNLRVSLQDFVQVRLNSLMESKLHGGEARRLIRRK